MDKFYSLRFTNDAKEDLEDILEYTLDSFGERQYWIYHNLLQSALELIQNDPFNIASRTRTDLPSELRTYNICQPSFPASHFLLYRVNEADETIDIGRILHKNVDVERQKPIDFQ